ncbi:MAG: sensor histidine kinase [Candidatus Bipolaricaulota bacterium]
MNGQAEFRERKAAVLRTILVRRLTLGVFCAVALVVVLVSGMGGMNPAVYSPAVWFLLTFPFGFVIARQRTSRALDAAHTAFFLIEGLLITVLIHFLSGSEWIGNVFYLFTVIYANQFLPRAHGALVTGWVVACYSGLVLMEAFGVVPHRVLFSLSTPAHRSLSYNVATILAGAVGLYAVVAFTVRTFAAIDARKNRLLQAREAELAELSQRLLAAQDEERRRIARGLHDGLIQSLAAAKLVLSPARSAMGDETYRRAVGVIDDAIRETRALAYSLRPPLLDDLGLLPALERLADALSESSGLLIHVDADEPGSLDVALESLVYHVASEALENVVRHAGAKTATVSLTMTPTIVRIRVEDDGSGIDPRSSRGLGLRGIEERVALCGGTLSLSPRAEGGAVLTAEVPIAHPRCDR